MSTPLAAIVDPAYRHVEKIAVPTGVEGALKWYDLREEGRLVDPAAREAAHALVESVTDPDDVGFVILHSCGTDVELLLVSRWRNENEIWERVFAKVGDADFVVLGDDDPTRGTFCVWELGIVNAERLAWADLLRGDRDQAALDTYLAARFSGRV